MFFSPIQNSAPIGPVGAALQRDLIRAKSRIQVVDEHTRIEVIDTCINIDDIKGLQLIRIDDGLNGISRLPGDDSRVGFSPRRRAIAISIRVAVVYVERDAAGVVAQGEVFIRDIIDTRVDTANHSP